MPIASVVLVVCIYTVLAGLYSFRLAWWEAPDEPAHYAEAASLAGLPPFVQPPPLVSRLQAPDPPAGVALFSLPIRLLQPTRLPTVRPRPDFLVTHRGGIAEEAVFHGQDELPPYGRAALALHLARLVAVLCGTITVALAYALGRLLFPDWPSAVCLAASVAWLPSFIFATSAVEPIAVAIAAGSLAILAAVRIAARPPGVRWWCALGAAGGVATLASPAGWLLAPAFLVAVVVELLRGAAGDREKSSASRWLGPPVGVLVWLALGGWWYLQRVTTWPLGWFLPGVDAALSRTINADAARISPPAIGAHPLVEAFFARFGWETTRAPQTVYDLATFVLLLAGVGLLLAAYVGLGTRTARFSERAARWAVVAIACLGSLLFVLLSATARPDLFSIDGRPLLLVAPAWLALVVAGVRSFVGQRLRAVVWMLPPALLAVSVATLPGLTWARYRYLPVWSSPPTVLMAGGGHARFPGAAALDGHGPLPSSVRAGSMLPVTLYWQDLPGAPHTFQAFVHIAQSNGHPVAQEDQEPGHGWYAPLLWQPYDVVQDRHVVVIPARVAPGRYRIVVGAYDLRSLRPYAVTTTSWPTFGGAVVTGDVVAEAGS